MSIGVATPDCGMRDIELFQEELRRANKFISDQPLRHKQAIKEYFWQTMNSNAKNLRKNIVNLVKFLMVLPEFAMYICIGIFGFLGFMGFPLGMCQLIFHFFPVEKKCRDDESVCNFMQFYFDNSIGLQCWLILINGLYFFCMDEFCSFCKTKKSGQKCKNYIHLSEWSVIIYICVNSYVLWLIDSPQVFTLPTVLWVGFIVCYQAKNLIEKAKKEINRIEEDINTKEKIRLGFCFEISENKKTN